MNDKQYEQILEQLPLGTQITKIYTAFENGEIRVITAEPNEPCEKRYVVTFEGNQPTITHKP